MRATLDTYWRGDFVHKMPVNVQQNCAIELLIYDMGLEYLIIESLRGTLCAGHLDTPKATCREGTVPNSLGVI